MALGQISEAFLSLFPLLQTILYRALESLILDLARPCPMVTYSFPSTQLRFMIHSPFARFLVLALSLLPLALPALAQKKKRVDPLAIPEITRDQVICFALYTVHAKTLKLTAQLYPLKEGEPRKATLEVKQGGNWKKVAEAKVIERGWTVPFRVEKWDDSQETPYRVRHGEKETY